jgi:hypothetical protein
MWKAMIKKIIPGGQPGADQAALDAAIQWNIPHGGCIPDLLGSCADIYFNDLNGRYALN